MNYQRDVDTELKVNYFAQHFDTAPSAPTKFYVASICTYTLFREEPSENFPEINGPVTKCEAHGSRLFIIPYKYRLLCGMLIL